MPDLPNVPGRQPTGIDPNVPHAPRIWNYWLGGKDHFDADRRVGDRMAEMYPEIVQLARADRAFLQRAVQYLVREAGIRQFLDIGTGLPTASNTHEVAQELAPQARVVYVDNDDLVIAHARALLTSTPEGATAYIQADLAEPAKILRAAAATLDFGQPVAIMLLGVLIYIQDTDEAYHIVRQLMDAVPSGSYLVIAHSTSEIGGERTEEVVRVRNAAVKPPMTLRNYQQLTRFFDGLELVEPGVVSCPLWRPAPVDVGTSVAVDEFCGVARKP